MLSSTHNVVFTFFGKLQEHFPTLVTLNSSTGLSVELQISRRTPDSAIRSDAFGSERVYPVTSAIGLTVTGDKRQHSAQ